MKLLTKFIFRIILIWLCQISYVTNTFSQGPLPIDYFGPPLDIPLILSGNFGEIRSNHYHSGIDIKTDSTIGKAVYAAAEGYISRIKVNVFGFGKALYINHPNGYTTVYGHLHHFENTIQTFVEKDQYAKESFETELFPDSTIFKVKKGDLIAWTGNTGGSEGPHLHFEIRETKTEKPFNPLLFGFNVKDTVAPVIERILFRQLNSPELKNQLPEIELDQNFLINNPDTIEIFGKFGLEFVGYDMTNNKDNHLGIFGIDLFTDDSLLYSLKQTHFSFNETKYVNAHINYEKKTVNKLIYERCYRLPGDSFSLNSQNPVMASIDMVAGKISRMKLDLKDINNNKCSVSLILKGVNIKPADNRWPEKKNQGMTDNFSIKKVVKPIYKDSSFYFEERNIKLVIPAGSIYQDDEFIFSESFSDSDSIPEFQIGERRIPLHHPASLSIKIPALYTKYKDKLSLASVSESGQSFYAGGMENNGWIKGILSTFGQYSVIADTIPPIISNYEIDHDSIFKTDLLCFKISDDFSGIASYRATIDDQWILMEYDAKNQKLSYLIPDKKSINDKPLIIEVTDRKQNKSRLEMIINIF